AKKNFSSLRSLCVSASLREFLQFKNLSRKDAKAQRFAKKNFSSLRSLCVSAPLRAFLFFFAQRLAKKSF
ncbi:hypothetical protein JW964_11720, partial [candidate division KSB1 bacterium]|nr:hypothetical protein [candidate division KSB1 bacterium]